MVQATDSDRKINFFNTYISPAAIDLVTETLRSTFISEGEMVRRFEGMLGEQLGIINPVALNSGTSALHLGLVIAGVGPGDEVIIPAQTFVATGLVVLQQGARPVFTDCDPTTGNIHVDSLRRRITERTKAIIPVHWGGYPCDMDEINAIAAEHGLAVIEDAAHALGATYKGKPVGTLSRFTAFSFQAIKHLTTGDGGALAALSDEDAHAVRTRRWFGIDRAGSKPSILGEREYDIAEVGYKYHLNDLGAALGVGNLLDFEANLKHIREIAAIYYKRLYGTEGMRQLSYESDRQSSYWLYTVLVERRLDLIRMLKEKGIPTSVVHQRIDRNSVFGGLTPDLHGQTIFDMMQLALPIHAGISLETAEEICDTIKGGW